MSPSSASSKAGTQTASPANAAQALAFDVRDVLLWLLFTAAVVLLIQTHELGHDEAQAWNIARAARWPWDVIRLGEFEGHTPLWHLVLWPFTRTGMPEIMQWLAGALGMTFAALLLWDQPFPRWIIVLILFGYFSFYEYTIVPRPYALALVLIAVLAVSLRRARSPVWFDGLICGLIGFTSSFGAVISVPLMLVVLSEAWYRRPATAPQQRTSIAVAVLIFGILLVASVWLIVFPIAATAFEEKLVTGGRVSVQGIPLAMLTANFPQLDRLPLGIGAFMTNTLPGILLSIGAAVASVAAIGLWLSDRRFAAGIWIFSVVLFSLAVVYSGSQADRHLGHLFLVALLLLWARTALLPAPVTRPATGRASWRQRLRPAAAFLMVAVLLYHLMMGVGASVFDVLKAQSAWPAVSDYIEENVPEPYDLFVDYGYVAGALHAYLDIEPYDMSCPCRQRSTNWTHLKGFPTPQQIISYVRREARPGFTTLVLTTARYSLPEKCFAPLATFPAGYRQKSQEDVHLYRLTGSPASLDSCSAG